MLLWELKIGSHNYIGHSFVGHSDIGSIFRFSEKSDVWAFGVLLWELWSYAMTPFGVIGDDSEVARRTPRDMCLDSFLDECLDMLLDMC